MSEPVEGADLGTAEESAEDVAADSIETDEAEAEVATDDDAVSDDSAAAASKHPDSVEYKRFRSVNERRKAAEAENATLKAQIAALQPKKEEPIAVPRSTAERIKKILAPAPKDMGTLDQLEYYGVETLRAHLPEMLDELLESRLGMKLDAAAATLSHAKDSTRQTIRSQFEQAAKAHGLDPNNENVQHIVGSAMDSGRFKTFSDAMDAMVPAKAKKEEVRRVNGKGAEIESVDLTGLSRVKAMPMNKEDAMKLAAQNKRVETLSVVEILRQTGAKA